MSHASPSGGDADPRDQRRGSRHRHVTATAIILLLLSISGTAAGQRATGDTASLVFVGQASGSSPATDLDAADLELLIACREPVTLDHVLAQGIPFRASRIDHLESLGLLRQEGQRFHATIPILVDEARDAVGAWVDDAAPRVVASTVGSIGALGEALESRGHPRALAAVASWLLEERVWDELIGAGVLGFSDLMRQQQGRYPNRDWWGALWYVEPAPRRPQAMVSLRGRDRSLLAAWSTDPSPPAISDESATGQFMGLLESIRNDRLELRSPERFEPFRRMGLIVGEETLNAPFLEWDQSSEGNIARQVQTATGELTLTLASTLRGEQPAPLSEADPAVAAAVLYQVLVPALLQGYAEAGLGVLVPETVEMPATVPAGGNGDDAAPVHPQGVSVVVWKDLPRASYPQFSFPEPR